MQKLNSALQKLTLFFTVTIVLGLKTFSQSPLSQINEQSKLRIAFNQRINLNQLDLHETDSFDWEIRNKNNEVIENQSFGNICSYVFATPGEYVLSISNISSHQNSECNHSSLPKLFEIIVSHYQVEFDVQNLSFSKTLTTENLQTSLILIVPVTIDIFSDSAKVVDLKDLKVLVQGVQCAVTATKFGQDYPVKAGKHNLQFTLKGNSVKHSYIMFDFVDQNQATTTYYHPRTL